MELSLLHSPASPEGDVAEYNNIKIQDVPVGTGVVNFPAVFKELKRQNLMATSTYSVMQKTSPVTFLLLFKQ